MICLGCAAPQCSANRCICWSTKTSSAPRSRNNCEKLELVMWKFTRWVLPSKMCLSSFRPSTPLNNEGLRDPMNVILSEAKDRTVGMRRLLQPFGDQRSEHDPRSFENIAHR